MRLILSEPPIQLGNPPYSFRPRVPALGSRSVISWSNQLSFVFNQKLLPESECDWSQNLTFNFQRQYLDFSSHKSTFDAIISSLPPLCGVYYSHILSARYYCEYELAVHKLLFHMSFQDFYCEPCSIFFMFSTSLLWIMRYARHSFSQISLWTMMHTRHSFSQISLWTMMHTKHSFSQISLWTMKHVFHGILQFYCDPCYTLGTVSHRFLCELWSMFLMVSYSFTVNHATH